MISYVEPPEEISDLEGYLEAVVEIGSLPIKISFNTEGTTLAKLEEPLAFLIENGEVVFSDAASGIQRDLLELYNNHWRCYLTGTGEEVDRPKLSRNEFIATLSLEELEISSTRIELWYDDGELFHGHSILVSATYARASEGFKIDHFAASLSG